MLPSKNPWAVIQKSTTANLPSATGGDETMGEEQRAMLSQLGNMKPACVRGFHGNVDPSTI